jgi:type II secretory pathway pseudopilin PulG
MVEKLKIRILRWHDTDGQHGYTLIELLGVAAIVVFLVLATQGLTRNYKRFAIEETAVQRLKQLAQAENVYRYMNNPAVNPDGIYGTFFDLQAAKLLPDLYAQSDEKRHTVNAFVPNYRLNFVQNNKEHFFPGREDEQYKPDENGYLIRVVPLPNMLGLKTFYMQEDGEVYWFRVNQDNAKLWPLPR